MERRTFLGSVAMAGATAMIDGTQAAVAPSRSAIGPVLDGALIWCAEHLAVPRDVRPGGMPLRDTVSAAFLQKHGEIADLHADFVRKFRLDAAPERAELHVFAFTRYRLYINGIYIGRGPARYQNAWPEYDSWDVASKLKPGSNVISILAHRDAPTGRIMHHAPGMAAVLVHVGFDGVERRIASDSKWQARPDRTFGPRDAAWSSISEQIDARRGDDWTAAGYDARGWPRAVRTGGEGFARLQPRSIPLMRETVLPWKAAVLPAELRAGDRLDLRLSRVSLAYHRLTLTAIAGSEIEIRYYLPENNQSGINRYVAREGLQVYEGGDVFACDRISIQVHSGTVTLTAAQMVEILYPFERVGSFESDDPFLDKLWTLCARSMELMSEDAYTDCADRERVEWMDCSPPAYEVTQVMMSAPDGRGGTCYSDPRLLRSMLRRTSLTAQPDGQIKAHTCSERWDIHAIMEDRSCDWVIGLRQYFEATSDVAFVRAMWPTLVGLLAWFQRQVTPRGLVLGREWEVWDNPILYQVCEGAGLNAFVYRALVDAAYLGRRIGRTTQAHAFTKRAVALRTAFNALLWDDAQGAYLGALFGPGSKRAKTLGMNVTDTDTPGGRYRPTIQAALFAFYSDIVPSDRRARLAKWMLVNAEEATSVMSHHYLFKQYYALDRSELDTEVLRRMRAAWSAMVESPWGTSWESLTGGGASKVHVYGILPGQYLGGYVLGVRPDGPITSGKLLIDPRPGDLNHADGVVVTTFGPVPIRWTRAATGAMDLTVTIPLGVTAEVRLRAVAGSAGILVNERRVAARHQKGRVSLALGSGEHRVRQVR